MRDRKPVIEPEGQNGERGSSLLEVLISLLLLLYLMIGILQMFTLAFLVNQSAMARTDMTFRAEQVAENLRYLNALYLSDPAHAAFNTLNTSHPVDVSIPLTAGTSYDLTEHARINSNSYWGSSASNVVEAANPPFFITVAISSTNPAIMTITVRANPKPGQSGYDSNYSNYLGAALSKKAVDYVAQIN